jgi:hypothetical protein
MLGLLEKRVQTVLKLVDFAWILSHVEISRFAWADAHSMATTGLPGAPVLNNIFRPFVRNDVFLEQRFPGIILAYDL